MNSRYLALAALLLAAACNISDPESNNETPDTNNNNKVDMTTSLDMALDLPVEGEDLPDAPDVPADDLGQDLGEPDLAMEDMAPDMPVGPATIPISKLKEKYFEALVGSYCALVWRCEHPPTDLLSELGRDDSYASCTKNAALQAQFGANIDQTLEAVRDGRISYDEEAAARCLNPIIEESNDPTFCDDPQIFDNNNPDCDLVFTGTVPQDGYCLNSQECEPPPGGDNAYCDRSGAVCYGTCKSNAPSNNDCNGATCTADQYCLNDGSTRPHCTAKLKLGDPCTQYESCLGERSFCAYSGTQGTCVARRSVPERGACIEDSQCYSGATCFRNRCTYATLGGVGDICDQQTTACKPGLSCAIADVASGKSLCAMPGVSGAPCYDTGDCATDLYCANANLDPQAPSSGRCTERKIDGKRCTSSEECESFSCDQDISGASVCTSPMACNLPD
jgi:hypothetical protein